MRRRADFAAAIRSGRRAASPTVVVHAGSGPPGPPLVGFVVARGVGGAVERNVVKRRLRAVLAERLAELPEGARVVVRALPAAKGAASRVLAGHVARTLKSAVRTGSRPGGSS